MPEETNNTQISPTDALIQALSEAQNEPEDSVEQTFAGNPMSPDTESKPSYATLDDIKSANQELLDKIMQTNPAQQTAPESEPAKEVVAPEESNEEDIPDFDQEVFMDKFYDNPAEAVKNAIMQSAEKIADKKVKKVVSSLEERLQPLLSQSDLAKKKDEVKNLITEFLKNNADGREYFGDMTEYIKANNLDPRDANTYTNAYKESKLNRQAKELLELRQNKGKTLDDYLNDDSSVERMSASQKVRDMVINNYLKGLNEGGKPATIGANSTTQTSAQPAIKPTSLKEAGAQLAKMLS